MNNSAASLQDKAALDRAATGTGKAIAAALAAAGAQVVVNHNHTPEPAAKVVAGIGKVEHIADLVRLMSLLSARVASRRSARSGVFSSAWRSGARGDAGSVRSNRCAGAGRHASSPQDGIGLPWPTGPGNRRPRLAGMIVVPDRAGSAAAGRLARVHGHSRRLGRAAPGGDSGACAPGSASSAASRRSSPCA